MSDNKKDTPQTSQPQAEGPEQMSNIAETKKEKPPLTAAESADLDRSVARQESANTRTLNAQKRVRILIPAGRSKHEQCPVPVGVNGRAYLIERGVEVDVPESVVHVLNLAVEQSPVLDGERVTGFRSVPRYPVQVLGEAGPASQMREAR